MSAGKNVAYNILINIINVAVPIITVPYTSRVFGVDNTGIVNFATTYALYFTLFINLGIPLYGIREIAKNRSNKHECSRVVSELFRITSLSTILFTTLYVVSIFAVPTLREQWPFLLVSGSILILSPFNVDWYFAGIEKIKIIALRGMAVKIIGVIALFVFVRERSDLMLYLIINAAIIGGGQVWSFVYMLRSEVTLLWRGLHFGRHFKPVFILFLSTLAISIYTMLDTLMLGFMSTYTEVGYYSSAIKISRMVLPIVTAASIAVIPRITEYYNKKEYDKLESVTNYSFSFMSFMAPPLTFGLMCITPLFVPLFFGEEFLGAITPMIIVSGVILLIGINNFYGMQVLIPASKDKLFAYAVLMGTITNFVLNLIFIPLWGAVGVAIATIIAELAVVISTIYFATKYVKEIRPKYGTMIHSVIASLPIFAFTLLIPRVIDSDLLSLILIIAGSAVTFFIIEFFVFRERILYIALNKVLKIVKLKQLPF